MLRLLVLLSAASAAVTGDGRRGGSSPRVISTKYGSLKGFLTQPGRGLQGVEVFLGVPYASPPFGSLRFMPPVTVPHWRGVRLADKHGPVCPQRLPDISNQTESLRRMPAGRLEYLRKLLPLLTNHSEDCLYLNIYVPTAANVRSSGHGGGASRLAVIVFVHGESYEWNSGNAYDGSVLASYANLVVVTINYRLGVFGFLPTLDANTRGGNNGLMDQVAALHWIQENIAEFGGDPRNVTIMGEGHGAACVHLLMLSPMAKNLFQRGILHSGSALSPWSIARDARSYARQLGEALHCPLTDNLAFLSCMRALSVSDILSIQIRVPDHLAGFGPTVDGIVIPKEPEQLMRDQKTPFALYDLLFGVTRVQDSYFRFSAEEDRQGLEITRRDRLLRTLVRNTRRFHLQEIFLTVSNEYTDWSKSAAHPFAVMEAAAEAVGDATIVAPLIRTANLHAQLNPATFSYVFGHQTESGDYTSRLGCVAGQELAYVFGAPLAGGMPQFPRNYSKTETALAETVMAYWASFAKTGDPSGIQGDESDDKSRTKSERIQWPQYDVLQQKYLTIGLKSKVRDHYNAHRLSLWLNLVPSLDKSRPGADAQHHLLEDHDNLGSYDGIIQLQAPWRHLDEPSPTAQATAPIPTIPSPTNGTPALATSGDVRRPSTASTNISDSMAVVMQTSGYSTALSVTIAVGCSLLILNVLIFAGVYYQRDKKGLESEQTRPPKMSSSHHVESHFGKFVRTPSTSAAPEFLEHNAVVALLPPKVPPKPQCPMLPPEMPEAQPLLHGEPTRPLQEMRVF